MTARRTTLSFVLLLSLAACGDRARLSVAQGTGPAPQLPPPVRTAIPTVKVGYWVDQGHILIRLTDDQILRTVMLIDAKPGQSPEDKRVGASTGEAYLQVLDKHPSRKLQVRCSVE